MIRVVGVPILEKLISMMEFDSIWYMEDKTWIFINFICYNKPSI